MLGKGTIEIVTVSNAGRQGPNGSSVSIARSIDPVKPVGGMKNELGSLILVKVPPPIEDQLIWLADPPKIAFRGILSPIQNGE